MKTNTLKWKHVSLALLLSLATLISACGGDSNPPPAADTLYFVHTDHLGTPQVITDADQITVWEGRALPFGETDIITHEIDFNVRFPGQYYDQESGLHYNYFRDYDPSLGRYVQSDPIGLDGGLNTFSYVHLNPLIYFDFFGLCDNLIASCKHNGSGGVRTNINGTEVKLCTYDCSITIPGVTTVITDNGVYPNDQEVRISLPGVPSMDKNGKPATERNSGDLACYSQEWVNDAPIPETSLTGSGSIWSNFQVTPAHGDLYEILDQEFHKIEQSTEKVIIDVRTK